MNTAGIAAAAVVGCIGSALQISKVPLRTAHILLVETRKTGEKKEREKVESDFKKQNKHTAGRAGRQAGRQVGKAD